MYSMYVQIAECCNWHQTTVLYVVKLLQSCEELRCAVEVLDSSGLVIRAYSHSDLTL